MKSDSLIAFHHARADRDGPAKAAVGDFIVLCTKCAPDCWSIFMVASVDAAGRTLTVCDRDGHISPVKELSKRDEILHVSRAAFGDAEAMWRELGGVEFDGLDRLIMALRRYHAPTTARHH